MPEKLDTVSGLKCSGKEYRQFSTGAQRDNCDGKGRPTLISPIFLHKLSVHLENGAKKYSSRNWEKGMPIEEYLNSALRHIYKLLEGQTDEPHDVAAAFNMMAFIHTKEMINRGVLPKELDFNPNYTQIENTGDDENIMQEVGKSFSNHCNRKNYE